MELIRIHSEQKIKDLFDNHFHKLVFHSFKITNDYRQSEEIVQDVFVKIWQQSVQNNQISDYKSYLYRAVQNSSINYLRHIKIRQKYHEDVLKTNKDSEKPSEEYIIESENSSRIQSAINKLPENWKEALIMSKYDNLKYHEIADRMNISQKTVEKYISKALVFLRDELKDILISIIIFISLIK